LRRETPDNIAAFAYAHHVGAARKDDGSVLRLHDARIDLSVDLEPPSHDPFGSERDELFRVATCVDRSILHNEWCRVRAIPEIHTPFLFACTIDRPQMAIECRHVERGFVW